MVVATRVNVADFVEVDVLDAVREEATVGEVCESLKPVFGEYREAPVF